MKAEDAAPTPVRGVNAKTRRSVIAAIRRSEPIEIKYQSLKRLGLDTDPAARRAQDQQIVLFNRVQLGQQGEFINGLD